jgi:hypothetical protein
MMIYNVCPLVSITLEQKLLKDRELQRGGYAAAFSAGEGLATARGLLDAPPQLAEKALRCLAAMAQTYVENVEQLISFSGEEFVEFWSFSFVFFCFFSWVLHCSFLFVKILLQESGIMLREMADLPRYL